VFTGLIEACVLLRRLERRAAGARLVLEAPPFGSELRLGQSVAVSGACLSLAGCAEPASGAPRPAGSAGADLVFELSAETLARTWFARAAPGRRVNLERALRLGDRLDGHLVSGHVDGLGRVVAVEDSGDGGARVAFEVAPGLARYLVDKGSVTLDGVSLTVVEPRGARFWVALIPLTLAHTSLGAARPGDEVHVEADLVARWIERFTEPGIPSPDSRRAAGSAEP
jgi:riboflavin synthase